MTVYVFANRDRLVRNDANNAFGNKLLHVLFVLKIWETTGICPIIPTESVLNDVFDIEPTIFQRSDAAALRRLPLLLHEQSQDPHERLDRLKRKVRRLGSRLQLRTGSSSAATKREAARADSRKKYERAQAFLDRLRADPPTESFTVMGHFWHYGCTPEVLTFRKALSLKAELVRSLEDRYPGFREADRVAVHYRGTDFHGYLRHAFPGGLALPEEYYDRAMHAARERMGGDTTFHLFSDDVAFLERIFWKQKYVIHSDDFARDWAAMHLMRSMIASNSSFSWTASLYNKDLRVQPAGGYSYAYGGGPIPYGFHVPGSVLIEHDCQPAGRVPAVAGQAG